MSGSTFLDRIGQNPIIIGILLFDGVSSLIFFLFPLTWFFLGDVCVFVGMLTALAYLFYPKEEPIDVPKCILIIAILGGIITALSFSIVIFLLIRLANMTTSFLDLFLQQALYTVIFTLTIAIVSILVIKVVEKLSKRIDVK